MLSSLSSGTLSFHLLLSLPGTQCLCLRSPRLVSIWQWLSCNTPHPWERLWDIFSPHQKATALGVASFYFCPCKLFLISYGARFSESQYGPYKIERNFVVVLVTINVILLVPFGGCPLSSGCLLHLKNLLLAKDFINSFTLRLNLLITV